MRFWERDAVGSSAIFGHSAHKQINKQRTGPDNKVGETISRQYVRSYNDSIIGNEQNMKQPKWQSEQRKAHEMSDCEQREFVRAIWANERTSRGRIWAEQVPSELIWTEAEAEAGSPCVFDRNQFSHVCKSFLVFNNNFREDLWWLGRVLFLCRCEWLYLILAVGGCISTMSPSHIPIALNRFDLVLLVLRYAVCL